MASPHVPKSQEIQKSTFSWKNYGDCVIPHTPPYSPDLCNPPYSPDLAPSDYHLFGPLKEGVRGQHFTSDQEVKHAVRNWLKMQPADFYKAGIVSLVHRWTVGIEKCGDYIEK